jgi:hypothetical protein
MLFAPSGIEVAAAFDASGASNGITVVGGAATGAPAVNAWLQRAVWTSSAVAVDASIDDVGAVQVPYTLATSGLVDASHPSAGGKLLQAVAAVINGGIGPTPEYLQDMFGMDAFGAAITTMDGALADCVACVLGDRTTQQAIVDCAVACNGPFLAIDPGDGGQGFMRLEEAALGFALAIGIADVAVRCALRDGTPRTLRLANVTLHVVFE